HNSLFTKEFSVSTAPEVGRIIDRYKTPSILNLDFLSNRPKSRTPFYISSSATKIEQYIAQSPAVKHHRRSAPL
ncbi:hypothetical protein, partial [Pseudomonas fluorescens]